MRYTLLTLPMLLVMIHNDMPKSNALHADHNTLPNVSNTLANGNFDEFGNGTILKGTNLSDLMREIDLPDQVKFGKITQEISSVATMYSAEPKVTMKNNIESGITETSAKDYDVAIPPMAVPEAPSSLYPFNLSASNRFLATDITIFTCGVEQLCNKNLTQWGGICPVRCDPCHCDDMCHFYGDCCPDLLFKDSPDYPSTPFPHVSCSRETWTVWGNLTYIYMVSSCPAGTSPSVAEKCENPDIGDQQQATPVSIVSSEVTYGNVFCAQCHEVREAKPWRHQVKCASNYSLFIARSKAHLWRLVLEDKYCDIESHPPDGVGVRKCFHSEVDSCPENTTGFFDNTKLKYLCSSFKNTVDYYGRDPFFVKYRNIFCAVCNGEILDSSMSCSGMLGPSVPLPLTVLLDFNPTETGTSDITVPECAKGQTFDPFSETCRNVTCFEGRRYVEDICESSQPPTNFTSYGIDTILHTQNHSLLIFGLEDIIRPYGDILQEELKMYGPVLLSTLQVSFLLKNPDDFWTNTIRFQGTITFRANASGGKLENLVLDALTRDMSVSIFIGENITLISRPYLCPDEYPLPYGSTFLSKEIASLSPSVVFPECRDDDCLAGVSYDSLPLSCPYLQYDDRFEENFIFDPTTYQLEFRNQTFSLGIDEFRCCGRVMKICEKSLMNITRTLFPGNISPKQLDQNIVLSMVSLVCISLSLIGLLLTFLIYCFVPKLRTLPGKNSMALILNLFVAQILFLTASNRSENTVLCQVFGVLIHYFWMSSFTWMMVSAYHMYTVFKSLRLYVSDGARNTKRLMIYISFSVAVPVCIIVSCIIMHYVQSSGTDIGYGGQVCFLSNPTAIIIFFAGPLGAILLVNSFFFIKTVLSIRSVPDMTDASNKTRKHHVFVYIKLSLLFGFTWIFGILASLFRSVVLQYVFVLLTGSQGMMIFIAYCVNKRTWSLLKNSVCGIEKSYRSDPKTHADRGKTGSSGLETETGKHSMH